MNEDIKKWQKVKPVFDELFDYPLSVALKKISNYAGLDDDEKSTVRKLLLGVHTKNTLIESTSQDALSRHLFQIKDLTGTNVGEYLLLSLISQGGMSSIYLAERSDGSIQKQVAIKVLAPWENSQASQNLFNQEQTILSKLRHPNIVTMHHGGVAQDGVYYMVMDYLENSVSLDEYIQTKRLKTREIIELAVCVAKAISYAHGNLVIHKDLKASNILIDDNGHVNVVDFGIASSEHGKLENSLRIYTPEIASPEQILGEKITVTTDIFSLAATFLSLLLKKKSLPEIDPQNYDPAKDETHIKLVINDSRLPRELRVIFLKALQIDPEKRFVSMDHFAADLENWLLGKPISILSDSRSYLVKKVMARNKIATIFAVLAFSVLVTSLILISNYAKQSSLAAKRADGAFNFLTEILSHADPFESRKGDVTIKSVLDANKEIPLASVNGDEFLKRDLHHKLSDIYGNLGFYKEQEEQLGKSLKLFEKLNERDDLKLLETKTNLAIARMGMLDLEGSIKLSKEVLIAMETNQLDDANIEIAALGNLLIAYGQRVGTGVYDSKALEATKTIILGKIDSPKITDPNALINALSALSRSFQRKREYPAAEIYSAKVVAVSRAHYGEDSLDYFYQIFDLAILKGNSKKYEEASTILKDLIDDVSKIDPYNSLLGRSWETYSTILFQTDQRVAAISALDKAEAIFSHQNDQDGLYFVLSKRAMYQYELYNFKRGINDQLEFLPNKINSLGVSSSIVLSSLANLAYMLFSIDETELANKIAEVAIELMLKNEVLLAHTNVYHANFAVLNWFHNNKEKALQLRNSLLDRAEGVDQKQYQLLNFLLSSNQAIDEKATIESIKNYNHKNDMTDLLNLLKAPYLKAHDEISAEDINQLCDYPPYFKRNKVIAFKVMYLSSCVEQYSKLGIKAPAQFGIDLKLIEQAKQNISAGDRTEITEKVKNLLIDLVDAVN